jgi:uncharacterized protein YcaQ
VSAAVARRYLVIRHLLAPPRALPAEPASVLRVMDRLGSLQFDPIDVTGRNHDLVLAARIAGYQRPWTDRLLYEDRALFEAYNKGLSILPTSELPWYRISWDRSEVVHRGGAFDEHSALVDELLDRIRSEGPLSSTDLEPRAAIDWYWRPTNQVRALLEALAQAGILGLTRREGNRRVYDLVERLFPPGLLAERRPSREQRLHKLLSRYRANGLLGRSGSAELWLGTTPATWQPSDPDGRPTRRELLDELVSTGALRPIAVDGIRGDRFIPAGDAEFLEQAASEVAEGRPPGGQPPGVTFLAPLDPLVWDRELLRSLFGFDYIWEVYVPAAKRRWGYYVLPILFGDRLVGRIEPRFERAAGTLKVLDIWWEGGMDPLHEPGLVKALAVALDAHRRFGGVRRIRLPRAARHRDLVRALRAEAAGSVAR